MGIQSRRIILEAMRVIVDLTKFTTEEGTLILFNAYNHLHVQLDGQRLIAPKKPAPLFVYDGKLNMVRTE